MKRRKNNPLTFKESVIVWMPYLLLKFLIQEKYLSKFLEQCDKIHSMDYLTKLTYVYTKTHNEDLHNLTKLTLYKVCFHDAFNFTDYWYRRYWEFEIFLKEYEKAHSK